MFKPIPVGIENFKTMIDKGCYYVDKTMMIKDILDSSSVVQLYTRPRRFGKTLNMSMLKYFFEKSDENNAYLFDGLNISQCGEKYKDFMGKYPVIALSLKQMKRSNFDQAFYEYKSMVRSEFIRHKYVLDSDRLSLDNREKFTSVYEGEACDNVYHTALKLLSACLFEVHGEKVIVLIDEYDVPLQSAFIKEYYEDMVDLIRAAFESVLKTNDSLEMGILTGCLRISKESIFTGLNNLDVKSILTQQYSEYFGFTEKEVSEFAEAYGLSNRFDDMKLWYDGYKFGDTEIYNPWSIINFINEARVDKAVEPKEYWANTSENEIIKKLIFESDDEAKSIVEKLIAGETVTAPIREDITYRYMDTKSEYIWSFLLFTGYLKPKSIKSKIAELIIPNNEVKEIYKTTVLEWFNEQIRNAGTEKLFTAVVNGDAETFENEVNSWLLNSISYFDGYENFYHGFLSGLLVTMRGYSVESNREQGLGRSDIIIRQLQRPRTAVIIEIKSTKEYGELENKCDEALRQINEKKYDAGLIKNGSRRIIKCGIAFCGKECMVKMDDAKIG